MSDEGQKILASNGRRTWYGGVNSNSDKTIFNPGSVGMPVEMMNNGLYDETNRFSTVASYIILEGTFGSKELAPFSINLVRLPYDIQKELEYLENSDMPNKNKIISSLKTACS